jgi:hypothetical protein
MTPNAVGVASVREEHEEHQQDAKTCQEGIDAGGPAKKQSATPQIVKIAPRFGDGIRHSR